MQAIRPGVIGPVRWDDPLANGLTGAWTADVSTATVRDLLGLNSATGSGLTAAVGRIGRVVQAAAFQAKATVAVRANLKPTKAASLFWLGTFDSAGSPTDDTLIHGVSFDSANSAPYTSYAVQRRSADPTTLSFAWSNNGTYTEVLSVTGDMPAYGTPFSFTATLRMGGNGNVYVNNRLSGTASAGAGPITYGTTPTLYVPGHMNTTAGTNNPGSSLAVAYSWNRDLTPEEVGRLALDPWCLVRPRPRRMFRLSGSGTTYNDTLSDAVTAADSLLAALAAVTTISGAVAGADGYAAAATFAAALADGLTAADGETNGNIYNSTTADAVAAADALLAVLQAAATTADGVTGADAIAAVLSAAASTSDAVTGADGETVPGSPDQVIADAVAAADRLRYLHWQAQQGAAGSWGATSGSNSQWSESNTNSTVWVQSND